MAGSGGDGVEASQNESPEPPEDKSERLVKFPMTRIKNIMKMDPDVNLASQDAVVLIAKATELFVQSFSKEASTHTMSSKRKTLQKKDIDQAIDGVDELAFLEGALEG